MFTSILRVTLASILLTQMAATQQQLELVPQSDARLFCATTNDSLVGAVTEIADGSPGVDITALTDGAKHLRRFGTQLYAVNRAADTIRRIPLSGAPPQLYSLTTGAEPMDVLVPAASTQAKSAWVTRRNDPMLMKLDLDTGVGVDVVDLSPVGSGAPIALGTMARKGALLFVQVRVFESTVAFSGDRGVLAVVDLATEQLVDVDPRTFGVQGIALKGAPPRFKMQSLGTTLYVSTTESTNDVRGGIEMVDMETLTSVGFAVTELGGLSDMGGFVMLDAERGYYVFHTDLLSSTHLAAFTVSGGTLSGNMIDLLGDTVDVLVHDSSRNRIYLPSGLASNSPGLYSFSTETNALVGRPLDTGLRPHDVVLIPSSLFETP